MSVSAFLACALLCAVALFRMTRRKTSSLPFPPGPPADPILGHLRYMPTENPHDAFHKWSTQYGDVMYLEVLGKPVVILSSEQAALDLLDKRSSNYSDRPPFPIFQRIGWRDILAFLPYGQTYRRLRKMLAGPFDRGEMMAYKPIQDQETSVLLMNLLQSPADLDRHVHRYSTAVIMEITYGHRVHSNDDEYFRMAEQFIHLLRDAGRPSLLDLVPALDKLPAWFPGAWFVKYIQDTKPFLHHMIDHPVSVVQKEMSDGTAQASFVSHHLEELAREGQLTSDTRHDVRMLAHQIFGGGSETSWHTVMLFVACMLLNPEAQRKGQEEIDRVVGAGRLPDFTDRDALPYVECIVQETMRWHPVLPLGVPHKAVAADEYRGMHIPAGATVIANARSITLDEKTFHSPHLFKPERFLPAPHGAGEAFPTNAVFGWGRRICPGRFLADNTVWLAAVRILAVFDIVKARDAQGNVLEPVLKFVTSVSSHPEPFPYDIRPRSAKAAVLITQAYELTQPAPVVAAA